ncbi:MAG: serine/threonine protein kinase [Gammaproteobacteria bacterium]|nr:serine/threonine protein kinase [Gammaproteobacteria bacterium]
MTSMGEPQLLKKDLFGSVWLVKQDGQALIRRDTTQARWWLRWLAQRLAAREARALERLQHIDDIPGLRRWTGRILDRQWLPGQPMQLGRPTDRDYYRKALTILRRMHRSGVVHNDTAKEPNWVVLPDGSPALIDFQIAMCFKNRGRLFRLLAREDLRHMLKHKRTYRPSYLTARERAILARPAITARIWQRSGKRVYLWITRGILGWSDREGADDRRDNS